MSSCEIEDNMNEKVLDDVDHVNVGEIKIETFDQHKSEDLAIIDPLSAKLFRETVSTHDSEVNLKEKVNDIFNHVNVDGLKKEPSTDLRTSKDPFENCDAHVIQENEHFMSPSNNRVLPDNESLLDSENKPKKVKIEKIDVVTIRF